MVVVVVAAVVVVIRLLLIAPSSCSTIYTDSSRNTKSTLPVALQPNSGPGRHTVEISRSHTIRHTRARQDSSERVISSSQRPLPTQQTQVT